MESQHRKILEKNRSLLVNNVVICDELLTMLKEKGIITTSVLLDIQKCKDRTKQVEMLLDMVMVRPNVYTKLCDVLHLTGHGLLSDYLIEQALVVQPIDIAEDDLFKNLPFLQKATSQNEKQQVYDYISRKVQEKIIRENWKHNSKDKLKVMQTKGKQLDQALEFGSKMTARDEQIIELTKHCECLVGELASKEAQVQRLQQNLKDFTAKYNKDMSTQFAFNMANTRTIARMDDKQLENESIVTELDEEFTKFISEEVDENMDMLSVRGKFEKLAQKLNHLEDLKVRYDGLLEERVVIVSHLGISDPESEDVVTVFKQFVVEKLERMESDKERIKELENECMKLRNKVKSLEFVMQDKDELIDRMNSNKGRSNDTPSPHTSPRSSPRSPSPRVSSKLSPICISSRLEKRTKEGAQMLRVPSPEFKSASAPNSPQTRRRSCDLPPIRHSQKNNKSLHDISKDRQVASKNVVNICIN